MIVWSWGDTDRNPACRVHCASVLVCAEGYEGAIKVSNPAAVQPAEHAPRPTGRAGRLPLRQTFRALRNPNFRLYWIGQVVSSIGTWMQRVAQAWLVLRLTDSPLALGIATASQTAPVLLLALFGGVLADRVPKRRLLLITQTIMLVQAALFALL